MPRLAQINDIARSTHVLAFNQAPCTRLHRRTTRHGSKREWSKVPLLCPVDEEKCPTVPDGAEGAEGAEGVDGCDGTDGVDGAEGVDGSDGADTVDGGGDDDRIDGGPGDDTAVVDHVDEVRGCEKVRRG